MTIQAIIPYLSVTDAARAVDFYRAMFQVEPYNLLHMPDGRVMHGEFHVGGLKVYFSEELPEHGGTPSPQRVGATTVAVHLVVDDVDAMVTRMTGLGSELLMEPTDMFWGERFARVRDPFGHEWGLATVLREMAPEEIQQAAAAVFREMQG